MGRPWIEKSEFIVYFVEILDIGWPRYVIRPRLSILGNIVKKSTKSSIFWQNIGEAPINRR